MKVGSRVRYIHIDSEENKEIGYYPPIGTFGTVMEITKNDMLVKWDNGTDGDGEWWCDVKDVEEADECAEITRCRDKLIDDLNLVLKENFDYVPIFKIVNIADELVKKGWKFETE